MSFFTQRLHAPFLSSPPALPTLGRANWRDTTGDPSVFRVAHLAVGGWVAGLPVCSSLLFLFGAAGTVRLTSITYCLSLSNAHDI